MKKSIIAPCLLLLASTQAANAEYYYPSSSDYYSQPEYQRSRYEQPRQRVNRQQPSRYYQEPRHQRYPRQQQADYQQPNSLNTSYIALRGMYSIMDNSVDGDYEYTDGIVSLSENQSGNLDDKVFGVSVAYGFKHNLFRMEVEGIYNTEAESHLYDIQTNENKVSISNQALMFNLYADYDNITNVTPYIGGGLGLSRISIDYYAGDEDKFSLAWQLGVGLNIAATENLSFDIGYRYMYLGKASLSDTVYYPLYNITENRDFDMDSYSHNIYMGLRYSF